MVTHMRKGDARTETLDGRLALDAGRTGIPLAHTFVVEWQSPQAFALAPSSPTPRVASPALRETEVFPSPRRCA
jgi:hypothetical protein